LFKILYFPSFWFELSDIKHYKKHTSKHIKCHYKIYQCTTWDRYTSQCVFLIEALVRICDRSERIWSIVYGDTCTASIVCAVLDYVSVYYEDRIEIVLLLYFAVVEGVTRLVAVCCSNYTYHPIWALYLELNTTIIDYLVLAMNILRWKRAHSTRIQKSLQTRQRIEIVINCYPYTRPTAEQRNHSYKKIEKRNMFKILEIQTHPQAQFLKLVIWWCRVAANKATRLELATSLFACILL